MLRFKNLLTCLMAASLLLVGCASDPAPTTVPDEATPKNEATTPNEATAPDTTVSPEPVSAPPESLKILAIGNSFSTDCMQYFYQIAQAAGVKTIVLGNLYYGGCSLAQHLGFAKTDSPSYQYHKNTAGTWSSTADYKMSDAIADEDWDYISLQQTSKTCGLADSYGETLTALIDYVRTKNTDAKLIWNMTWAYQQDSTHSSFPNYGKSQQKMYDMIIDCVNTCIIPETRFDLIIPCMTSIQNARTSFLGDTLTRDGYHLDYYIGRYIAGLTWYAAITGAPIDDIKYNPSTAYISEDMLAVARESVANAVKTPCAVTPSAITTGVRPDPVTVYDPSIKLDPADFYEADAQVALANGIDLSKYTLLSWPHLENTYWNCTSKPGTTTPKSTAGTYNENVCTAQKYALTDLPLGTVFICDAGWQYRLEIYTDKDQKYAGSRPELSTAQFFTLTDAFMGDCKYIAWNISSSPKKDISAIFDQAACHLRVYLPNS